MDILKILHKEKTSPNKKSKFNKIYSTKNKRNSLDEIPLKNKYLKEKDNKNKNKNITKKTL